jgi:hypothetical protein
MPSRALTIAIACNSAERRPPAAWATTYPVAKPIPHATIPIS